MSDGEYVNIGRARRTYQQNQKTKGRRPPAKRIIKYNKSKTVKPNYLLQSFRVIVDDRERAVIPYLEETGVNLNIERITTGDYCIMYPNGRMIIIERKSWGDLADSIKDHRIKNMRDLIRAQNEQDAKTLYIIEGHVPSRPTTHVRGIAYHNLRSKLDHMIIRDGMTVMETRDPCATAKRIIQLGINCATLDCYNTPIHVEVVETKDVGEIKEVELEVIEGGADEEKEELKKEMNEVEKKALVYMKQKKPVLERKEIELIMLCKLPGVSDMTAKALLEGFSFYQILKGLSKVELESIKYKKSGSTLRKGTIKKLSDADCIAYSQSKILSCIKGISTVLAVAITGNYSLSSIINGDVSEEDLAAINVGERKVGKANAKKILEFFRE